MKSDLNNTILRRSHTVFVPADGGTSTAGERERIVNALEAELAGLGYLLSRDLREQLLAAESSEKSLVELSRETLATLGAARGAHVHHVAQFRQFPRSTPADTVALYVERVISWLFQAPDAPCLLCGSVGTVNPVSPCAHLVCSACFDGADYSGCPICHRRIDLDDPFLKPAPDRGELPEEHAGPFVRLVAGSDIETAAAQTAAALLRRQSALSPAERDDLMVLVEAIGEPITACEPEQGVAVRETQALVYGALLARSEDPASFFAAVAPRLRSATDVLRTLNVYMGSDAGLVEPRPKLRGLSRPLRRAILGRLEQMSFERLGEDLGRHRSRWIRLAEALRPFEYHARYPQTATAFAALRRTPLDGSRYARLDATVAAQVAEAAGAESKTVVATKRRVKLRSFASKVEAEIARGDVMRAALLLRERPGELARRYDHLLRLCWKSSPHDMYLLFDLLDEIAPKLPTPLLLTLRSAILSRSRIHTRRVFFPRGAITRPYGIADQRQPIDQEVTERVAAAITMELLRRGGKLTKISTAVLDEALADLLVPIAERTASKSLVALPRGSQIPLPSDDEKLRLFVHWTDAPGQRVDLDLSVAFFDSDWRVVGECDYTNLRGFGEDSDAAVHSGDLTSAPAPLGASEFVDLDIPRLRALGIRHAAMIVFSYNDIAFERMEDAFAGFMRGRDQRGKIFDARSVEQRFDLTGNAKMCIPMLIDIDAGKMLWVDVQPSAADGYQAIWRHRGKLSHLCCDLYDSFNAGTRPSLYEVAAMRAAASAETIQVRGRDGKVKLFRQRENEHSVYFIDRLVAAADADEELAEVAINGDPVFAALVDGDLALPADSISYALRQRVTPHTSVTQLTASDLSATLER